MYKISRILSSVFSPILLPTYAMIVTGQVTVMHLLPQATLWIVTGVVFLLTAVMPAVSIVSLYRLGMVSGPELNERTERTIPYLTVTASYLVCGYFMQRSGAPGWLSMFFYGGALASLISTVVNRWWKISAHAAAMGGATAMLFVILLAHQNVVSLDWWITGTILATGAVMTARVYMQRHTLMQVLAGCANGFLCVLLLNLLF